MSNRLANEKSPYLRQHSENPVNWYPWCGEAFEAARANDQPVFLSIGYSTCHWCHVMAHESFESDEVAALLNREFVCIKVDREERPDIDAVYMRACEVLTGAGGWPLTIVMTADQKPFFAGTYFPKNDRYGQPGLFSLLREISAMWKSDRDTLLHAAVQLTSALREAAHQSEAPSRTRIDEALASLRKSFDSRHGGFGGAPKFPAAHNLLFLMTVDETGMAMAERTLRAMARGGIFDQIGGGFSRYSTDEKWLVPHFEKMLYDNALLLWAYAEAYRKTSANVFADIARRTADYMLRELKAPEGGFFAGQDADSDGVEGGYYTLTPNEVRGMIGEEDGEAFCRLYGIGERKNIPNLIVSDEAPWPADDPRLKKLYDARRSRAKLHLDDKILLSWNAWAIIALTESAVILGASAYLDSAKGIVQFIESKMTDPENRLYLRWCRGEAAHAGQLDDYAAYALALLRLYRATFDIQYLELSVLRAEQMLRCFADDAGGFFQTAHDAEKLIDRPKETYDGAVPSGNSSAAMVLETLARLTGERKWREAADCQIRYIAGAAARYPAGHCFALLAMHRALQPERLLVACSSSLPQELREIKLPADLPVLFRSGENAAQLAKLAPFTVDYPVPAAGTTWYLCENGACQTPTADFAELPL